MNRHATKEEMQQMSGKMISLQEMQLKTIIKFHFPAHQNDKVFFFIHDQFVIVVLTLFSIFFSHLAVYLLKHDFVFFKHIWLPEEISYLLELKILHLFRYTWRGFSPFSSSPCERIRVCLMWGPCLILKIK